MIQILSKRTKNNPILIGAPGVGKTAIVEGLAYYIANSQKHRDIIPEYFADKMVINLDLPSMLAGMLTPVLWMFALCVVAYC